MESKETANNEGGGSSQNTNYSKLQCRRVTDSRGHDRSKWIIDKQITYNRKRIDTYYTNRCKKTIAGGEVSDAKDLLRVSTNQKDQETTKYTSTSTNSFSTPSSAVSVQPTKQILSDSGLLTVSETSPIISEIPRHQETIESKAVRKADSTNQKEQETTNATAASTDSFSAASSASCSEQGLPDAVPSSISETSSNISDMPRRNQESEVLSKTFRKTDSMIRRPSLSPCMNTADCFDSILPDTVSSIVVKPVKMSSTIGSEKRWYWLRESDGSIATCKATAIREGKIHRARVEQGAYQNIAKMALPPPTVNERSNHNRARSRNKSSRKSQSSSKIAVRKNTNEEIYQDIAKMAAAAAAAAIDTPNSARSRSRSSRRAQSIQNHTTPSQQFDSPALSATALSSVHKIKKSSHEIATAIIPTDKDILLGQPKFNKHPGNVLYRATVRKFQPEIKTKGRAFVAREIIKHIYDIIGGRFLKIDGEGRWEIMPYTDVMRKVRKAIAKSIETSRKNAFKYKANEETKKIPKRKAIKKPWQWIMTPTGSIATCKATAIREGKVHRAQRGLYLTTNPKGGSTSSTATKEQNPSCGEKPNNSGVNGKENDIPVTDAANKVGNYILSAENIGHRLTKKGLDEAATPIVDKSAPPTDFITPHTSCLEKRKQIDIAPLIDESAPPPVVFARYRNRKWGCRAFIARDPRMAKRIYRSYRTG